MKITDIKPQKKKKNRFNIYLDNKFFCSLSEKVILDYKIKIGQEITEKEIEKLIEKDQYAKALEKAIRFLGYRPRTEKEIYNKLLEKKFNIKVIKKVIKKLKEMDYLSDENFVELWIKDRLNIKPSGKKLLKIELKQKGIAEEIIQKKLNQLINSKIELEMAQKALEKAQKKYQHLTGLEKKKKITDYLLRRGFDWELIKKII